MRPAHRLLLALSVATLASGIGMPVVAQHYSDWSPPVALWRLNTPFVDGCPFISRDNLSLYFASNRQGGPNDIYVSERESPSAEWGEPVALGLAVNTEAYAEECPALSIDGHLLFFVSNRPGCGGLDIHVSFRRHTKNNSAWEPAQNLGCVINTTSHEVTPSHFNDDDTGQTLLYVHSNRPTGPGGPLGTNIFVSTQQPDGTFGAGVLVEGLNTDFDDQRPNIRRNGLEMFFESNRPGSSGVDLWVATRATTSDPWGTPVNLSVLNSAAFDGRPSISAHGDTLYFMSNRAGSMDLYVSTREQIRGWQR